MTQVIFATPDKLMAKKSLANDQQQNLLEKSLHVNNNQYTLSYLFTRNKCQPNFVIAYMITL